MNSRSVEPTLPRKRKKRWGMIAFVVIAFFVAFYFGERYIQYNNMQAELASYEQELAQAEKRYADLEKQKQLLYDDSYLETLARANLGMVREGETLVSPMEENAAVQEQDGVDSQNIH